MRNRVEFKDGVWRIETPCVLRMIDVALKESPALVDNVMVVTDVLRRWLAGGYHPEGRAVDVRTGLTPVPELPAGMSWRRVPGSLLMTYSASDRAARDWDASGEYDHALLWAQRIRERLGNEFDVVYGIEVNHVDHIHIEWDRKKEERWHADS